MLLRSVQPFWADLSLGVHPTFAVDVDLPSPLGEDMVAMKVFAMSRHASCRSVNSAVFR